MEQQCSHIAHFLINLHFSMLLEIFPFRHLRLDPPRGYYCDPDFASKLGSQRLEEVHQCSIGGLNTYTYTDKAKVASAAKFQHSEVQ